MIIGDKCYQVLVTQCFILYVPCRTCTALLSCQPCVDRILAVEVLYVSDSHIVTSHADNPLDKRVWGERNFRSDRINTVSDKNRACRNDGGEGRVEG